MKNMIAVKMVFVRFFFWGGGKEKIGGSSPWLPVCSLAMHAVQLKSYTADRRRRSFAVKAIDKRPYFLDRNRRVEKRRTYKRCVRQQTEDAHSLGCRHTVGPRCRQRRAAGVSACQAIYTAGSLRRLNLVNYGLYPFPQPQLTCGYAEYISVYLVLLYTSVTRRYCIDLKYIIYLAVCSCHVWYSAAVFRSARHSEWRPHGYMAMHDLVCWPWLTLLCSRVSSVN